MGYDNLKVLSETYENGGNAKSAFPAGVTL